MKNLRQPSTPTTPDPAGGPVPLATAGRPVVEIPMLDAADQEAILELFRRPHGKGTLSIPDAQATVSNPLCGEAVTVTLSLDHGQAEPRVTDIRFQSDGCSISQASASMMTDLVRGRSEAEIRSLAGSLHALLHGDRSEAGALGRLRILGGVARLPSRVACALLPWDALLRALECRALPPAAA